MGLGWTPSWATPGGCPVRRHPAHCTMKTCGTVKMHRRAFVVEFVSYHSTITDAVARNVTEAADVDDTMPLYRGNQSKRPDYSLTHEMEPSKRPKLKHVQMLSFPRNKFAMGPDAAPTQRRATKRPAPSENTPSENTPPGIGQEGLKGFTFGTDAMHNVPGVFQDKRASPEKSGKAIGAPAPSVSTSLAKPAAPENNIEDRYNQDEPMPQEVRDSSPTFPPSEAGATSTLKNHN